MTSRLSAFSRLLGCMGGLLAAPVLAHGGFPETSSFTQRRDHPEELLTGFTHGALLSRDSGQTWRWVCAEAMRYGSWTPERYEWLANGDLVAATGSALIRSRDGGCTWTVSDAFPGLWVTGLAPHPTEERRLYASTGRPAATNALYRSEDSGETWTATALRGEAVLTSVRVAPSDPRRLYVTGTRGYALFLFHSGDGGETWTEAPLKLPAGLVDAYDLKLMGVSPANPDEPWLRVSTRTAAGGILYTVLRGEDGGRVLTAVLSQEDPLVDMDVSADGRTAWVATYNHFFRERGAGGFSTLPLPAGNACVKRLGSTLYACGSTWVHEWALARSTDEGDSWAPVFSLREVRGVHQCPEGTPVREQCGRLWPQMAAQLGISPSSGGEDAGVEDGAEPEPPPRARCAVAPGGSLLVPGVLVLLVRRRARR